MQRKTAHSRSSWTPNKGYSQQIQSFFERLRKGQRPEIGVEDGIRATVACLRMIESSSHADALLHRLAARGWFTVAMKILQLGPYPPPNGGVQTHIAALVDFLRQSGVNCDVMNLNRFRLPSADGIFYPSNSVEVLAHLLSHRYDVIHLHIGGRIFLRQLGLAIACSALPKTHCVLTFHSGGYPSSEEGRLAHRRTLRAFAMRRFDRIIAVNSEIAGFFERLGVRPDHIRLISPHAPPSVTSGLNFPPPLKSFFAIINRC